MKRNSRWHWGMKLTALLLVLTEVTGVCGRALADTLKLPKSVQRIESEAFRGDAAISRVEVPYGAESIGSRAFADSGVSRIYIPNTVAEIAEDAFDGTDAVICSGFGSYAKEWADEHGVQWEDCQSFYANDMYDAAAEYEEGGYTFELELTEDSSGLIMTDGITDPEILQAIETFNEALMENNALNEAHNENVQALLDSMTELADYVGGISVHSSGTSVTFELGEYQLVCDSELTGLFNGSEPADILLLPQLIREFQAAY